MINKKKTVNFESTQENNSIPGKKTQEKIDQKTSI